VANVLSLMARAPKGTVILPIDPSSESGMAVNAGDWRVTFKPAKLRSTNDASYRLTGYSAVGESFRVRSAAWNTHHDVLWLRVTTASGKTGWVNARKTLPAAAPSGA
jgi:hypothetical protein